MRCLPGGPALFEGQFQINEDGDIRYALDPTGERFIMLLRQDTGGESHEHLQLVLNWFDELQSTFAVVGGGAH